jgi:putative ABC transport system substrate-binding protein
MELIQKLVPTAKTIGVIYNPGEANSVKGVAILQELAPKMGLSLALAPTTKTADTMSAAMSLIGKVQAIFIPNDNTAMASITGIVALGKAHKLPIFTPDYDSVEAGVLAVRACPHSTMGYKAGQLVVKILKGEKASDLPVEVDHSLDLAINITSATDMGISIPAEMKTAAKLVS